MVTSLPPALLVLTITVTVRLVGVLERAHRDAVGPPAPGRAPSDEADQLSTPMSRSGGTGRRGRTRSSPATVWQCGR
jgi:hypothetical protein